jgi:5-methylcytosine-specific restriction endonuclease McrA
MVETETELRNAAANSHSISDVCRALGIVPAGGNYASVRRRLERHGIDISHFRFRRRPLTDRSDQEILAAAEGAGSAAEVLRRLGVSVTTTQRRQLRARVEALGVPATQFAQETRRVRHSRRGPRIPLSRLLVAGSHAGSHDLRKRLLAEEVLDHQCAWCGLVLWNGELIPLELDHVNGDRTDNRLENLRLLCPNCHAQTPTYRGRNIGRVV